MKKTLVSFLKKVLPAKTKSKLKVFVAYHPYLASPVSLLFRKRLQADFHQILSSTATRKGIVICPPTIDWHTTLYQRPHQIARAFAREGYLVFFCTNNIRFDKVTGFQEVEENLYLVNNTAVLREVSSESILLISWAINKFYADRFTGSTVVYEYMDELNVFDGNVDDLERDHDWLVKNSDLVVATADKLYEEVSGMCKKAVLVPNGVDVAHFLNPSTDIPEDMRSILKQSKVVVGYYGAIAEWFDYGLIRYAAQKRPEWAFVIIGPLDYDKSLGGIKSTLPGNVHFLGAKNYDVLPIYGRLFDVATIPFVINKITESTSPIKLFEYMALGKPIVTTDMPECRKYASVLIAKGPEEFVTQIEKGLTLRKDLAYLKKENLEASDNSWSNRVKAIIASLPERKR